MSRGFSRNYELEIAKGNIPGTSSLIIRGHNNDIDSAAQEDIWEAGGTMSYLASAETMNIVSTSTDDDGSPAGIGAQTVSVQGVDGTGAELIETVTMNGTTNVTTTGSFLRVNFMVVLTAGSSLTNVGSITATASTAATIQDEMDALEGVSQSSHHTIPLGKTGYLYQVELNAAKISGGGSPEVEFRGFGQTNGAGRIQLFDKKMDTGVQDELDIHPPIPSKMPARTDIKLTGETDVNNTECRTRMYLITVDD